MKIKYPNEKIENEREYIIQCECDSYIKLPGWVLINQLATSCGCESVSKLVQARRRAYTGNGKPYPIFYNAKYGTLYELDQLSDNEDVEFVIEANSCYMRQRCPVCYDSFRPDALWVKIKDTGDYICDACIDELTPEYGKILERFQKLHKQFKRKTLSGKNGENKTESQVESTENAFNYPNNQ